MNLHSPSARRARGQVYSIWPNTAFASLSKSSSGQEVGQVLGPVRYLRVGHRAVVYPPSRLLVDEGNGRIGARMKESGHAMGSGGISEDKAVDASSPSMAPRRISSRAWTCSANARRPAGVNAT